MAKEELKTKKDALIDFYNRNLQGKAELECQYLKLDKKEEEEVVDVNRNPNPRQRGQKITAGKKKRKVGEGLKDTVDFLRVVKDRLKEEEGIDTPELDLEVVGKFEEYEAAQEEEDEESEIDIAKSA